jgi:uncharacterized membrane protein YcaP (DUF421 family)
LASILIRVSAMFLIGLALMRILGKPSIGELSTMDLVVVTIMGDGLDSVIYGEVSILQGAVYLTMITIAHLLVGYLASQNDLIFKLTNSPPRKMIQEGTVLGKSLAVERMRMETVESQMRLKQEDQLEEVKEATLESNGQISVVRNTSSKPVQKKELKLLRQEK